MKIDVLGCWGGYPSLGGATAGYLVTTSESKILLDCGSGVLSKISEKTKVEDLNAVFLSHFHYDHTADVGVLQYIIKGLLRTKKRKEKLKLYAPIVSNKDLSFIDEEVSELITIKEENAFKINDIKIELLQVSHTLTCYAVKLTYKGKIFVYSADTAFNERLIKFAEYADLFICEATISPNSTHTTGEGHMDAAEAGRIAKEASVNELLLTHLPHDGDFNLMKQQAEDSFGKPV